MSLKAILYFRQDTDMPLIRYISTKSSVISKNIIITKCIPSDPRKMGVLPLMQLSNGTVLRGKDVAMLIKELTELPNGKSSSGPTIPTASDISEWQTNFMRSDESGSGFADAPDEANLLSKLGDYSQEHFGWKSSKPSSSLQIPVSELGEDRAGELMFNDYLEGVKAGSVDTELAPAKLDDHQMSIIQSKNNY